MNRYMLSSQGPARCNLLDSHVITNIVGKEKAKKKKKVEENRRRFKTHQDVLKRSRKKKKTTNSSRPSVALCPSLKHRQNHDG